MMGRIQLELNLIIYIIYLLMNETFSIYSIQCCTGFDNTCSSKPVDCPSNVCFKLVLGKGSEERGCFEDLIELLNPGNNERILNEKNLLTNAPLNDQCHLVGAYGHGISLCRCTSHLCNSTSKDFSKRIFLFLLFLQYFTIVFLF